MLKHIKIIAQNRKARYDYFIEDGSDDIAQQNGECHALDISGEVPDQNRRRTDNDAVQPLARIGGRARHWVGRHEECTKK